MNYQTTLTSSTTTSTSGNPYIKSSPAPSPPTASHAFHNLGRKFESATRKAENFAENLYNHFRTGPGLVDVAMTRLDQAARVITDGGCDAIFGREFGKLPAEKIHKAYVCYLSTTNGPVMGTLYISNKRVGFRSDNPVCAGGQWVYYKVVINVDQILTVNPSSNMLNPSEKYIEVLTRDGHEFWFMGFIFYEKAIKNLNKAMQRGWGY